MDQIPDALELGLRVLASIVAHETPAPSDVQKLRELAPEWADSPTDQLAREVIQRVIKQRRKAAVMGASSS
jgi:hypothetical protein